MTEYRNGNHVTYMWIAGILAAVILAIGGAWASRTTSDISDLHETDVEVQGRTSVLETRADSSDMRLERIEKKIDLLLERR